MTKKRVRTRREVWMVEARTEDGWEVAWLDASTTPEGAAEMAKLCAESIADQVGMSATRVVRYVPAPTKRKRRRGK